MSQNASSNVFYFSFLFVLLSILVNPFFSFAIFLKCVSPLTAFEETGRDFLTTGIAEKYLALLRKIYTHINLSNYFLCRFSFVTSHSELIKNCCFFSHCCSYWLGLKDPTEATG